MIEPAATWERVARPMRRVGRRIEAYGSVGSTNDRARELLDRPDGDGAVVVADEQTAGRGRRGRTWISPAGANLLASVAIRPELRAERAWQLGQSVALAVADACGTVAAVGLKWPNDLVASDMAKVGGLLVETLVSGDRVVGAVAGIGINVNWRRSDMPAEIAGGATSLFELAGGPVDRVALLDAVLDRLGVEVERLEAGTSPLPRYRAVCVTLGQEVVVATPDGTVEGMARDIDPQGALIVETAAGPRHVSSGDVVRLRPSPAS
jgi:BirA family biotin operon repressor/biotin-[acetyl-CoA-carboxylase] ligase